MASRIAGIIFLKADGAILKAKGSFTYGLGKFTREAMKSADGTIAGYKESLETPAFIEGEISDDKDFDLNSLDAITDGTITLELATGKIVTLSKAFHVNSDGLSGTTEEGVISVRFEGESADIVK